jgi:hypothetical protein
LPASTRCHNGGGSAANRVCCCFASLHGTSKAFLVSVRGEAIGSATTCGKILLALSKGTELSHLRSEPLIVAVIRLLSTAPSLTMRLVSFIFRSDCRTCRFWCDNRSSLLVLKRMHRSGKRRRSVPSLGADDIQVVCGRNRRFGLEAARSPPVTV